MLKKINHHLIINASLFILLTPGQSFAQQSTTNGDVEFTGEVLSTCSIGSSTPGSLLAIGTNGLFLGSGGALDVTTNGGALISVGSPRLTSAPSGATLDDSTSTATITFDGQTVSNGDAAVELGAGSTNVNVSVSLTPSSASGFPTGQYTAATTITCEFESPPGILG